MKKLILSLFILNLLNIRVYGETNTIPLSYNVAPSYTVTIPVSVDVTNDQTEFTFSVSGDIYYDCCLQVLFDESVLISNGYQTSTVYVNQSKTLFTYEELCNNTPAIVSLTHSSLKPGDYTGVLNLMISLKEGA